MKDGEDFHCRHCLWHLLTVYLISVMVLGTQGNACDSVPREWRGPVWPDSNSVFQSPPASISCLTFFYLVKTRARLGKMRAFPSALKQDEVKLKFRISQAVFESLLSLPR